MFLQAKKSLGQHFLNSKHALEQIIKASGISEGSRVLEIGPGTGVLTEALILTGASVVAVEKDSRAIELLNQKFQKEIAEGRLKLVSGDILADSCKIDIDLPYTIVANIPYYITGSILEKFLEKGPRPDKMVLLVQKEVADRIVAKDGKESILSISVKAFGKPKIIAKVSKGAFIPVPKVDSAILAIENISDDSFGEGGTQTGRFFEIVKAGFAHKRKYVVKNLEEKIGKDSMEKIWKNLSLDSKLRAENIPVDLWLQIANQASR